ncbi:hypothetical protein WR25_23571 [Diploscapter pachys]|uniref:Uncharacterized protein n=1 Tax=Diploscapter pachys TaxID=2018661 RepID=A0A2A2JFC9_9BILA|nr:hypothetical protein WR25_23571 [Diploscapter pachys]
MGLDNSNEMRQRLEEEMTTTTTTSTTTTPKSVEATRASRNDSIYRFLKFLFPDKTRAGAFDLDTLFLKNGFPSSWMGGANGEFLPKMPEMGSPMNPFGMGGQNMQMNPFGMRNPMNPFGMGGQNMQMNPSGNQQGMPFPFGFPGSRPGIFGQPGTFGQPGMFGQPGTFGQPITQPQTQTLPFVTTGSL